MGQTFIVQIKITGKWTFLTRGINRNQIQSVYDSSVIEYGSSAVRILMSNGKKEDGSIRWTIAQVPIEPEPEPDIKSEPAIVPNKKGWLQQWGLGFIILLSMFSAGLLEKFNRNNEQVIDSNPDNVIADNAPIKPRTGATYPTDKEIDRLVSQCDENIKCRDKITQLTEALTNEDYGAINTIISNGINPHITLNNNWPQLSGIAAMGNPNNIEVSFKAGSNLDVKNRAVVGGTPLMQAAGFGRLENIKKLLELGANINAVDEEGENALTWAFSNNNSSLEVIEYLMSKGLKFSPILKKDLIRSEKKLVSTGGLISGYPLMFTYLEKHGQKSNVTIAYEREMEMIKEPNLKSYQETYAKMMIIFNSLYKKRNDYVVKALADNCHKGIKLNDNIYNVNGGNNFDGTAGWGICVGAYQRYEEYIRN